MGSRAEASDDLSCDATDARRRVLLAMGGLEEGFGTPACVAAPALSP